MKSYQQLAPNSVKEGDKMYNDSGADYAKVMKHAMPNTRTNDYITNDFAGPGPGAKGSKVKHKGKSEHIGQENEYGNSWGV